MENNNFMKNSLPDADTTTLNNRINQLNDQLKSREKCIIAINEFSDLLNYLDFKDINVFQSMFMGFTAESIDADRVLLYFYEKEEDILYPGLLIVYKDNKIVPYDYYSELMDIMIKNGEDICGNALYNKNSIHMQELDSEIYKGIVDKKINMEINSIISIPIIIQNNLYGVIEVANKKNNKSLDKSDYNVVSIISKLAISKMEQNQLLNWANTDNLTQLFNFHYYQILLEQKLAHAERYPRNISIVIIDIDDFKTINDTYGHAAGNIVLKKVSKIIMDNIRINSDIPIRYGGDEFLLLLPDTAVSDAKKISQNILKAAAAYKFEFNNNNVQITLSIGINHKKLAAGIDKEDFIKDADKALYRSKKTGKNKISIG